MAKVKAIEIIVSRGNNINYIGKAVRYEWEDHLDEEMTVDLGDGIKMVDNVESLIIYGFGNEPHEAIRRAINWWLKDLEENGLIAWT